jgi:muramoyltetrapeptide carboxypeptidase
MDYFKKCLFEDNPFVVKPSTEWSDDMWFLEQENRVFYKNEGYKIINKGTANGK